MKLLNLTIRNFIVISVSVILIGIPAFYLVIQKLYIDDVDEELFLRKAEFKQRLSRIQSEAEIKIWQKLDGDIELKLTKNLVIQDSIYQTFHFDTLSNELEPYRELSTLIYIKGKPHHLIIRLSLVESEDLISGIALTQAALLILLLTSVVIINQLISKKIWKPFYSTLEKLKNFEIDKNPVILPEKTTIKEFEDLNTAITYLAKKNHLVYQSQKQFTENASHEMQTPLALLNAKLELLMQTPELSERQAELIIEALAVSGRLHKLNKNLLLLAKIENNQFSHIETINLASLILRLLTQYSDRIESQNLSLSHQLEPIFILANPTLIEILLSNLLSNAIRHNYSQGIIKILLTQHSLSIENSGRPLEASAEQMFERFRKDNTNPSSIGLGLAIAKQICDIYHFSVSYTAQENVHQILIVF